MPEERSDLGPDIADRLGGAGERQEALATEERRRAVFDGP